MDDGKNERVESGMQVSERACIRIRASHGWGVVSRRGQGKLS